MTLEQQQIAIAEACGWKVHPKDRFIVIPPNAPHSVQPLHTLPDYLNDLNAMHEAEELLLPDDAAYSQRNFYASELGRICLNDNGRGWKPLSNDDCFPILHATAAQRAEAFLKTLNLWNDEA
jgi:hypothetical protein